MFDKLKCPDLSASLRAGISKARRGKRHGRHYVCSCIFNPCVYSLGATVNMAKSDVGAGVVSLLIGILIGYLICAIGAMFMERDAKARYAALYADFLKLVNEISIRSGGRTIFRKDKPLAQTSDDVPMPDRGAFRIITPSMAEVEAMDLEDSESDSNLDDVDMEHLRRTGAIQ